MIRIFVQKLTSVFVLKWKSTNCHINLFAQFLQIFCITLCKNLSTWWLLAFHSSFSQWNLSFVCLFVYRLEKDEGPMFTDLLHDLQLERERCKSLEIKVSVWLVVSSRHLFTFPSKNLEESNKICTTECHLQRLEQPKNSKLHWWIKIKSLKPDVGWK